MMRCPLCSNEMVKAQATNFGPTYDYCRTCKKELSEMEAVPCGDIGRQDTDYDAFGDMRAWANANSHGIKPTASRFDPPQFRVDHTGVGEACRCIGTTPTHFFKVPTFVGQDCECGGYKDGRYGPLPTGRYSSKTAQLQTLPRGTRISTPHGAKNPCNEIAPPPAPDGSFLAIDTEATGLRLATNFFIQSQRSAKMMKELLDLTPEIVRDTIQVYDYTFPKQRELLEALRKFCNDSATFVILRGQGK